MGSHGSGRGLSCHTMRPWASRDWKLVTSLKIKPNTKVLFHSAHGFHFGGDKDLGSDRKQMCVRVRAHHKKRRPSCEVESSLRCSGRVAKLDSLQSPSNYRIL